MHRSAAALFLVSAMSLSTGAAHAQQCPQCLSADACIKQYRQATAKIQKDLKKGVSEQRRGREQPLRQRFSEPEVVAGNFDALISSEIERLKDCLAKVR